MTEPSRRLRFSKLRLIDAAKRSDIGGLRAEFAQPPRTDFRRFQEAITEAFAAAASEGHLIAASYLIDQGAEPHMRWGAIDAGGEPMVKFVLERCRDSFPEDRMILLSASAGGLSWFIREAAQRLGWDQMRGDLGAQALLAAARQRRNQAMRVLVSLGAMPRSLTPTERAEVFRAYGKWDPRYPDSPPQSMKEKD